MSKTDNTKPYDVRVREEGGVPWSDVEWSEMTVTERQYVMSLYPDSHRLRKGAGRSRAYMRAIKRARNKRIRRQDVPNTKRTWDLW